MICPACDAEVVYFFGKTLRDRQRFVCYTCGRQFDRGAASPSTCRTQ